jgi:hypothetical protein
MSMAKPESFSPAALLNEPLPRAKRLAEPMAQVLNDEDVSDVAITIALLTSAVVNHDESDPAKVTELVNTIRELEDRLLAETALVGELKLQQRLSGWA